MPATLSTPAGLLPGRRGAWGSKSRAELARPPGSFSTPVGFSFRPRCISVDPIGSPRPGAGATARRDPSTLLRMALTGGSPPHWSATLKIQSKRYRALKEKVKSILTRSRLTDAIKQLKTFGTTKFIQSVEVSTNLGIDPRQSDQNVRGSIALPAWDRQVGPCGRVRAGGECRKGDRRRCRYCRRR